MAITIPSGCWVQKDVNKGSDDNSNKTLAYPIKGGYSSLETLMLSLTQTTVVISGWIAKNWNLQRLPGSSGLLTINCVPDDMVPTPTEEDPDAKTQEPLKDIWSIKPVRNDVSIMAYCGEGENEPKRALIEAWMKEPDGELAKKHRFRRDSGEIVQLTTDAGTMDLVQKIEKGIESVIRFYPVVTRKRTYSQVPPACLENLGFIDTPPGPSGGVAKGPNGLAAAINAHQWLKVQDDADQGTDSNWTRTESWMGIKKTDSKDLNPWDADLYGANRWAMPHNHQNDSINS